MGNYINFISENTDKVITIVNIETNEIVTTSTTNTPIFIESDIPSYMIYISNPMQIDGIGGTINFLSSTLGQFLSFVFLLIVVMVMYVLFKQVKKGVFSR